MERIIRETEEHALAYLKAFGFQDEQVNTLISQGKKDLVRELTKLQELMAEDEVPLEDVNNVLHALKGLLFQLGNHDLAQKLVEIREDIQSDTALSDVKMLLDI